MYFLPFLMDAELDFYTTQKSFIFVANKKTTGIFLKI